MYLVTVHHKSLHSELPIDEDLKSSTIKNKVLVPFVTSQKPEFLKGNVFYRQLIAQC